MDTNLTSLDHLALGTESPEVWSLHSAADAPSASAQSDDDEDEPGDEDGPDGKKVEEPIEVGMTTMTKDLYREDDREPWQEWAPEDIGINSKSTPDSAKFALIVRREKVPGDTDEPVLALHSIKVQSPLIKKQLGPVFSGYRGINTNLKTLEFRAPFREFFYRWEKFEKASPGEENEVEKTHYKLLADIISAEIRPHIDQVLDLLRNHVISFDYVWALFEPGAEIYTEANGTGRLYLLDHGSYAENKGAKSYHLACRFVDTDGEAFGWKKAVLAINGFQDVKSILELDVIPSHLHPGMDAIRKRLTERGRDFEKLKGIHHKAYSGAYQLASPIFGAPRKQNVGPNFLSNVTKCWLTCSLKGR